jgi:hypothetical protein
MKILQFNFHAHTTPHVERDADIIQQHLDAGDEVVRTVCKGDLPICYANPNHALPKCALCYCRRESAASLLSRKIAERSVICLTPQDRETIASFSFRGKTLAELKELTFDGFDIGLAVAAALVDQTRDPDSDPVAHAQLVRDWIVVCLATYLSALNILKEERPDRVYAQNGRVGYLRAILRACQARGTDCYIHDAGSVIEHYALVVNRLLHEIAPTHVSIEETWSQADPATREAIGRRFFEERAKGIGGQWSQYTRDQDLSLLPEGFDRSRRNIALFMGSEYEYASVGEEFDRYKLYEDQNDGIARIAAALESTDAPIHVYVRAHPHTKGDRTANMQRTLGMRSPKVTVIPPESPVSSYRLLWACEKTLTFGSTVGIEAVYWGKPSILAGPSYYRFLGATYNPESHEALVKLLVADLPPKPKEAAFKFGYHELRSGRAFAHFEPEAKFRGKFKGKYLDVQGPWLWRVLLNWLDRPQIQQSGSMARASLDHRRLVYRRLGVVPVEDTTNFPYRRPSGLHKKIIERALATVLRRVFATLYKPALSTRPCSGGGVDRAGNSQG